MRVGAVTSGRLLALILTGLAVVACGSGARSAGPMCGRAAAPAVPGPLARPITLPPGARVLTRDAVPAGLAAFGATVVWSEFDTASMTYRLVLYRHGRARPAAIPGRCVPFDASIGPDRRGAPIVSYVRCQKESGSSDPTAPDPARGCRIYLYSPASGHERLVGGIAGASLKDPVVWRGRLAWIQGSAPGSMADEVLTRTISPAGTAVRVDLIPKASCYFETDAAGTREHCQSVMPAGYARIALRGPRLAAAVEAAPVGCGFGTGFITLTRPHGSLQTVDGVCQGMAGQDYEGPVFDGPWLYFHRRCTEDPGGCGRANVYRVAVGAVRGTRADDGVGRNALGFAVSDGREYAIAGSGVCDTTGDLTSERCPVVEIRNLRFG